jgi:hypothetical protein
MIIMKLIRNRKWDDGNYFVAYKYIHIPCKTLWEARLIARKLYKKHRYIMDIYDKILITMGSVDEHGEWIQDGLWGQRKLMNTNNPLDAFYEID